MSTDQRKFVGFAGYPGSGKDTAANALLFRGWHRISIGDILRDMLYNINPVVCWEQQWRDSSGLWLNRRPAWFFRLFAQRRTMAIRLQSIVDAKGWDYAKQIPEVRQLLQRAGGPGTRDVLGDDVLYRGLDRQLVNSKSDAVMTDVRWVEDGEYIQDRGGIVIRLMREGTCALHGAKSETVIDELKPDYTLNNNGSAQQLHEAVLKVVAQHFNKDLCTFDAALD